MKKRISITGLFTVLLLATSCYTEVIIEDEIPYDAALETRAVLESFDLWYVDIQKTTGNGEVFFLETAFTISFRQGVLMANNNLVGIGKTGSGYGIEIGNYDIYSGGVSVDHDIDGWIDLELTQLSLDRIELYDPKTDVAYRLVGLDRANFDYEGIFYANIDYFLQEYNVWEKIYTSDIGSVNDFDAENFLQFDAVQPIGYFRSSTDASGTSVNSVQWDYEGEFSLSSVQGDNSLKILTLDYDYLGNDYFELYVIDDGTIELYHPESNTVYEFEGRGFQYILKTSESGLRKKRSRSTLPVLNLKRKRKEF